MKLLIMYDLFLLCVNIIFVLKQEKKLRLIIEEELNLGKEKIMELEKESKVRWL